MKKGVIFLICICLLSGCATKPVTPEEIQAYNEANDPLEPFNRAMFETNMLLDTAILNPIAKGYRFITPEFMQTGISNFFDNLKQPSYLINSILQGNGEMALDVSKRFLANTLLGLGGLFDVADDMQIPVHSPDFGQTFAAWGWETSEPYLVLPILGPSNPRDALGTAANMGVSTLELSPIHETTVRYGIVALDAVQAREKNIEFMENLKNSSTDFYATVRSMYRQNREKKINTVTGNQQNLDAYDFEFEDEE